MMPKAFRVVVRAVQEFMADDCLQLAGGVAYFALFALFPLLIFLVAVVGLFVRDEAVQRQLVDQVLAYLPLTQPVGAGAVEDTVRKVAQSSGTLGILSLLGMAWSGSNLFSVLRKAINTAFDLTPKASFFWDKGTDLLMVVALPLLFLSSALISGIFAGLRTFGGAIPALGIVVDVTGFLWGVAALVIPLMLSFVACLTLYWVAPRPRIALRYLWPGAVLGAILFEAAKAGFGFYVANFGKYDAVYGSLGAAVALLFWIYVSSAILLLGAELSSEYRNVYDGDDAEPAALPAGQRAAA